MIGCDRILYVQKSKVLGVTLDDEMLFKTHSKAVLRSCWYFWSKISKNTTRLYGLNTSSLTLLFKTIVLPRLMYASTVWLDNQQYIFKDLWSRVLLKLTGSEYHTQKDLTELMLDISPLNMQFETNAIKFLLKGLSSDDDMIATILQIEQEPKHPYYRLTQLVKSFFKWKEKIDNTTDSENVNCTGRKAIRQIDLCNFINHKHCQYTKEEIKLFQNHQWNIQTSRKFPEIELDKWEEVKQLY